MSEESLEANVESIMYDLVVKYFVSIGAFCVTFSTIYSQILFV